MEIRPARFPEDYKVVTALFHYYQEWLDVDLRYQYFDKEVAELPGKYATPRGNILLAWKEDTAVGSIAWHPMSGDVCEIKRLFVRPEHTGKGIGKALLAQALDMIRAAGCSIVRLDSLERLEAAKKLYISFGFRACAPYNKSTLPDVYYMERNLAA